MTVRPAPALFGTVTLPSDKSIAQRAMLFAALGDGPSRLVHYPPAGDPQSTLACVRQLGIAVTEDADGILVVEGRGLGGLRPPEAPVDCGNSGTAMRLLCGVLAGQPFGTTLVGDASLSKRPMGRVTHPLAEMGALIETTDGHAPLEVIGGQHLRGITYRLPVASAQVKTCVLLAGHFAEGETTVIEPVATRDHTERMLGLSVVEMDGAHHITVEGGQPIAPRVWTIPRDFSAAAFLLVAGSTVPEGEIVLPGVGLNPSRAALLEVLHAMGADIAVTNERAHGGEPIADLTVRPAALHGVTVEGPIVANLIDEIPILAVAGTQAEGTLTIRDARELRVKETDRIAAMAGNLRALGAEVKEFEDGLAVTGGAALSGATVSAFDDHRIAMAMGVAGLVAQGETTVDGAEAASVSFPGFWDTLDALRA